jgi:basic membrane protein A
MIKRVDVAVYNCMMSAKEGTWAPGSRVLGLKEDAVGYSLDDDNKALITDDMKQKVEAAKARIIAGELQVQPYKQ